MNVAPPVNSRPAAAPAEPLPLPLSPVGGEASLAAFALAMDLAMDLAGTADAAALPDSSQAAEDDGKAVQPGPDTAAVASIPPTLLSQDKAAAVLPVVPGMVPAGGERLPAAEGAAAGGVAAEDAGVLPSVTDRSTAVPSSQSRLGIAAGLAARLAAQAGVPASAGPGAAPAPIARQGAEPSAPQGTDAGGLAALPLPPVSPAKPEENAAGAGEPTSFPAAAAAANGPSQAGGAPASAPVVKLPAGTPEQWRSPLLEALGERIRFELGNRGEQAVIRLDPPMMGSVEVVIRHQAGMLQVQLSASNGEVVRQLQSISGSLHQDLSQRQYTDVSVQVFADGRDGGGRQDRNPSGDDRRPGRALAEAEAGQPASPFVLSHDRV